MNDKIKNVKSRWLCFCDASSCVYATAVYFLQRSENSESKPDLLFSKTRLAPLKKSPFHDLNYCSDWCKMCEVC